MEKIVTKGIVLRATATKEADYILNILTDTLGRIAVVARGARRKGSRITASCELLAFSELTLYQRGSSSTRMDFSNSSLIVFSENSIPIRNVFDR